jgi:hypothetical protein
MSASNTATTLAGLAVVLAGGVLAVARGFNSLSSPPALAGDLETLLRYTFEIAPLAGIGLVGLLLLRGFDII